MSSAVVYVSLAVTAGLGLVLLRMARALSRVGDALAVAAADRPAAGRHHRGGGGGPGPGRRRAGQPDGNAWDDDGYRAPAGQPGGLWKPERRPRGTAARVLRAVFTFGAAFAAWYATGFSTAPLAGAGAVAAFIAAAWLTRRRRGRVNPGA